MNMNSLVSVSAVATFSETAIISSYIICVNNLMTVLFGVLKIKLNLVKLTFRRAISSNQVMGMSLGYGKYTRLNMAHFLHLIG